MAMQTTMVTDERIAEAWKLHRSNDHKGAIKAFEDILRKSPEHADAYYGLGLAQKALNDKTAATRSFQECLRLARKALDAVKLEARIEGQHGSNNLNSYDDDRYMMLSRMIHQRLYEMGAATTEGSEVRPVDNL
ncbi:MAG: tetratricopeptide repeat protein [Anaerolineae bacterium]|jgi:tetratricopeptide (TPR) repeat protein|nr:tetratricopeptide repeat protein [Anaerolineae bacterium]